MSSSGQCPSCERRGPLGDACTERVCRRQGVHFIPESWAREALEATAANRETMVGQFIGDFLIVSRLGLGGFGRVLLGMQRPLFRLKAAVKLIETRGQDAELSRRIAEKFENEAAVLASLHHPNIVRYLRTGVYHDQPYLAMEYVAESRTLKSEMNQAALARRGFELSTIKHILTQLLNALASAHQQSIIHRDIKPENIMLRSVVGDDFFLKLVDFGLAKVFADSTETSVVLGTITYMAPEQLEAKNLGPWTDLYAVGVIAFELMTGQRIFPADTDQSLVMHRKLSPEFDPFAYCSPHHLPENARVFLRRALARYPEDRYQSAAEMRVGLWDALSEDRWTEAGATDFSLLLNAEELSHLKREQEFLERERESLARERAALEAERRRLESERASFVPGGPLDPEQKSDTLELSGRPQSGGGSGRRWLALGGLFILGFGLALALTRTKSDDFFSITQRQLQEAQIREAQTAQAPSELAPPEGASEDLEGQGQGQALDAPSDLPLDLPPEGASEDLEGQGQGQALDLPSDLPLDLPPEGASVALEGQGQGQALDAPSDLPLDLPPDPLEGASVALEGQGQGQALDAPSDLPLDPPEASEGLEAGGPEQGQGQALDPPEEALAEPVRVAITSQPTGAAVYLDGKRVGMTPWTLEGPEGQAYSVELRLRGYRPQKKSLVLGEDNGLNMELVRRPPARRPAAKSPERATPRPLFVDD